MPSFNRLTCQLITFFTIVTFSQITLPDAEAALVTDATSLWTAVPYAGPNQTDYPDDQQTGNAKSSADIVGDATNPAFYTQFDDGGTSGNLTDGTIFFRARLGAPGGSQTPAFDRNLFVGIDGDGDGSLDLYLGVHNQGSFDELALYGPGTDLNISPNTTSITGPIATYAETATSYDYSAVDTTDTDVDGDTETDYFVSFAISFQDIVDALLTESGVTIDENTLLSYVLATATQDNSFNQDINGIPKNFDGAADWSTLGGLSAPISASGNIASTPEPGSLALMGLASLLAAGISRRRRRVPCSRREAA